MALQEAVSISWVSDCRFDVSPVNNSDFWKCYPTLTLTLTLTPYPTPTPTPTPTTTPTPNPTLPESKFLSKLFRS